MGMTSKPQASRRAKIPKKPPQPARALVALSPTERWYVDCLLKLSTHMKRPVTLPELASWLGKAVTPCYVALLRAERKGYLRRNKTRQFVLRDGVKL